MVDLVHSTLHIISLVALVLKKACLALQPRDLVCLVLQLQFLWIIATAAVG